MLMMFLILSLIASVDINTANVKELVHLSGVGKKKAEAIVQYRATHGCFHKIQDLEKVKGLGKKIVEKNKKNITISECKSR